MIIHDPHSRLELRKIRSQYSFNAHADLLTQARVGVFDRAVRQGYRHADRDLLDYFRKIVFEPSHANPLRVVEPDGCANQWDMLLLVIIKSNR